MTKGEKKLVFKPLTYPKVVRYADNYQNRKLKALYPKVRDEYTKLYDLYNQICPLYDEVRKEYDKLLKRHNSLLRVAKNVRKKIPRTVIPKKPVSKKRGDATYLKTLTLKATLKDSMEQYLQAKMFMRRYGELPASLNVLLVYERFLQEKNIDEMFFRILYIITLYRYCLYTDLEWWGIKKTAADKYIIHYLARGFIEKNIIGRNRVSFSPTQKAKHYVSRLKVYSYEFYKDLFTNNEIRLDKDIHDIKTFKIKSNGKAKLERFIGKATELPTLS